jgi:predicted permease
LNVEADGTLGRADVWAVTGNFHSELGAVPEIGRTLMPADVDLAAAPAQIAVLGNGFWQRHYGGARDVIGKTIKIEGIPFTVIGVTRRGFTGMSAEEEPEVTVPLTAEPLLNGAPPGDVQTRLNRRDALWLDGAGRLKSGVTIEQARAQLTSLWPAIRKELAPIDRTEAGHAHFMALQLKIESGSRGGSFLRDEFSRPLYVLLGISGLVLLLTCVNVASLMLARAASRSHELGVRIALGAARARLVRQLLTESMVLSLAGALIGLALAFWGAAALAAFITREVFIIPAELNLSPDWRVLGFSLSAAIVTGVLFGAAPAWRAMREDPNAAMQQGSRTIAAGAGFLGKALIVAQVALSIILLAGAGLFIRSLEKLRAVHPGFRIHGALTVNLYPKPGGYTNLSWVDYYRTLTERIQTLPGVASAGLVHVRPANLLSWTEKIRLTEGSNKELTVDVDMIMPGAFQALGIGLLRGRQFTWEDGGRAPRVAIVSRSLTEKLFPGDAAIGEQIDITTNPKWRNLRIVGIVSNASLYDLRKHEPPTLYLPSMQYADYMGWSELIVQTRVAPAAVRDPIRRIVESLGHEYVVSVRSVEQEVNRSLYRERIIAILSLFFGCVALLLSAIGLYGLIAFDIRRRSREIAIRIAIGAPKKTVRQMVLREAFVLAGAGVAIGLPCSIVLANAITGMLFGVSTHDPLTALTVSLTLLATAAIAAFAPARAATRLDPIVALRCE